MMIVLMLLIGALLIWLAATNRVQTFFAAMSNPTGVKK